MAKITDGGASAGFTWAIQNSGGVVIPNAIAVNGTNVYVVGRFLFTLVLGTTTFTSTGISGGYDVFVTKITDAGLSGSFTWALQGAGPRSDYAAAVAVNGSAVYVAGGFSGTVGFGSADLTSVAGSDDVFITQLLDAGSSGRFTWAQSAGGTDYEQARSVAIGPGNKVYVGGNVVPVATFGNLAITNSSTNPVGFLASLTDAVLSTNASTALVGLQVYPNPATTATTVLLPTAVGATHTTLTLTDALGRVVRHLSPTFYPANERGLRQKIDVGGLPAGIYTLRVQIGSTCTARQLVITD
ncbi:T9SS type A sorting domain-containing protein [Hymenobacter tibetensis]|uniref:T9SS type A sorting domain-containing protein n=1 Tax=Hymenobacter tibetensis TaxID=497967 RepID=A0ABY4D250_9BACT|nr:T9SS type A sorting domain-containing protein [Hymenobacter tibetensis]UOG76600.1 T9SS type A sorting domain-containing protein [Hymenobacter tibetensis]